MPLKEVSIKYTPGCVLFCFNLFLLTVLVIELASTFRSKSSGTSFKASDSKTTLTNENEGCNWIDDYDECVTSRDGRTGQSFSDSACMW